MTSRLPAALALVALLAGAAPAQTSAPPGGIAGALVGTPGGGSVTVASLFDPSRQGVLIAAHRADSGSWFARALGWLLERRSGPASRAENSLAAIDAAIAAGAHIIEIDVRHTRDGVLVLMHDAEIDRTTDGHGRVEDLTWADLQRVNLLPRGRIPTFDEALRHGRGRCVFDVDMKTSRVNDVVAAIQAAGAQDSCLVFDGPDTVRRVKALDPTIEVMPRAGDVAQARALLRDPVLRPRVVHIDTGDLEPALVAEARHAGVRLWVNALGPADVLGLRWFYRRLIRRGAGVIQTDRPEAVARAARNP